MTWKKTVDLVVTVWKVLAWAPAVVAVDDEAKDDDADDDVDECDDRRKKRLALVRCSLSRRHRPLNYQRKN